MLSLFRWAFLVIFSVALLATSGCDSQGASFTGPSEIRSAADAAGEYAYPFAKGPVEVFTLREDLTFRQELFPSLAAYKANERSQFRRGGKWSFDKNTVKLEGDYYSFCEYPDPERFLDKPVLASGREGLWMPPNSSLPYAQLVFSEDFGYILVRLTNRNILERKY